MNLDLNLPPLNLPQVDLKLIREDGIIKVFDPLRDKYVALTPEEYVRRHFSEFLIKNLHYPASNIANEVGLKVHDTKKRCDTLVVDRFGEPFIIVEYKAPNVKITQDTFDQIVRYNSVFKAKYIVVSNGMQHYCCAMDYKNDTYNFIPQIPDYKTALYSEN